MTFVLKGDCAVSPDHSRGGNPHELWVLEAGTPLVDVPQSERDQLSPAHFVDDYGSTELPEDWRTDLVTLDHDKRQAKARAAEEKERDKRRDARRAEKAQAAKGE